MRIKVYNLEDGEHFQLKGSPVQILKGLKERMEWIGWDPGECRVEVIKK